MINSHCKVPVVLAYIQLIYTIASFYYMCKTKNIGTPFNDTLTPLQKIIKMKSAEIRAKIFRQGLIVGIMFVLIVRPFKHCN